MAFCEIIYKNEEGFSRYIGYLDIQVDLISPHSYTNCTPYLEYVYSSYSTITLSSLSTINITFPRLIYDSSGGNNVSYKTVNIITIDSSTINNLLYDTNINIKIYIGDPPQQLFLQ